MAKKAKASESKPRKTPAAASTAKAAKAKPAKRAAAPKTSKSSNSKSPAAPSAPKYASLEDARSATIDALLATIEDAERRLTEAKRADSIERLVQLGQGQA